jgi:hypothetical protein cdivTM_11959
MIVYFIVTQYSIDINYTYLKKIHDTINQLGHKPSRKWLSKERRFIESINRKDGINWGVFTKKDLEAIGGADLVVAEVTDENIAIGHQIAVAVQQKKPVLMLSRHDISSVSLSSNVNSDFDQFVTIKRYDLNTVSGILKGFIISQAQLFRTGCLKRGLSVTHQPRIWCKLRRQICIIAA